MISGESSFMNTHQLQHQMKIDEDTEIIATHHRLYLFFIWFTAPSHLSNNEKYYYLTNKEFYNYPTIMYYLISKRCSVIYVEYYL